MKRLSFIELGATLFIPATHKNLEAIVLKNRFAELKSLVIDTEDGLAEEHLEDALTTIEKLLLKIDTPKLHIFLRPRNVEILEHFLNMKNIQNIEGFVLPKFSLANCDSYMKSLENTKHLIMPSIEGDELFNLNEMHKLKDELLKYKEKILLVRFGLEDMLSRLGMRRSCKDSVFDLSAPNFILASFITTFKSAGFQISGGVYPCFKDEEGFLKDAKRDLKEGLFSKTIIHPNQIAPLHKLYRVSQEELNESNAIIQSREAVFNLSDKMAERSTMRTHSQLILERADVYGVF